MDKDMKKILYILAAVLAIISCGKDNTDPDTPSNQNPPVEKPEEKPDKPVEKLADKLIGEWHSTSIAVKGDLYLGFTEDGKFELYQKIGEGSYRLYRGTWNIDENTGVLSGKYNDSEAWASSYKVEFKDGSMTFTSTDASAEKSSYEKGTIPAEVKENCIVEVKSGC